MFTENANRIFNRAIDDYHRFDDVDHPVENPFDEGSLDHLLYMKNWVDTVQWHLEDIIRDPQIDPVEALASALNDDGYVTKVDEAPAGAQLCQHHCPVAHVAAEFPQLCEAETQMFSRLLGTRVQRLATIAHGDGVCTTNIPLDIVVTDHEMVIEHTPRERKRAVENHRATDNNREATSA